MIKEEFAKYTYVRNFEFLFHNNGNGETVHSRSKPQTSLCTLSNDTLTIKYSNLSAGNEINFVTKEN
jgi:hypothetical protein